MEKRKYSETQLLKIIRDLLLIVFILVLVILLLVFVFYNHKSIQELILNPLSKEELSTKINLAKVDPSDSISYWIAPDINSIQDISNKTQISYGRELIVHTSTFFGPNGKLAHSSNGLNCQNCHLDAGTKVFGNNYGSVASLYPKFRARSGKIENIYKRVNDCFERSLNGKSIDTSSKEMQAIKAYIEYLGSAVEKGKKALGSGLKELGYMDRAANVVKGEIVYKTKCKNCHQENGEGLLNADRVEYTYPPLWGNSSYTDGAGLFRIGVLAKYVKYNMPLGANFRIPQLNDEEAWDVAAFINSMPRPHLKVPFDWPDISKKPVDLPFGPYSDNFTENQHKYGPWGSIEATRNKNVTK